MGCGPPRAHADPGGAVGRDRPRDDLRAPDHAAVPGLLRCAPDRESQIELGAYLLRWFMPQIVFYGIGAVASGLLNAERRFAAPMFAPVLNNLVAIATFIGYAMLRGSAAPSVDQITTMEKLVLGAGTTLGVVAMTVALWPSLRSIGFRWRLTGGWNHPAVRRLGKLSALGHRLRGREPARLPGHQHPGRRHRRGAASRSTPPRSSSSRCRTRSSASRSSPPCCPACPQQWTDGRPAGVVDPVVPRASATRSW